MNRDKTRPSWKRFGLRGLLILVAISSVAAAWIAWNLDHRRKEHAAISEFEKTGGSVIYHSFFTAERTWLEKLGDDWFGEQARSVELRKSTDVDLTLLGQMPELKCIALSYSQVSNLSPLAELRELDEIYLEGTNVRDLSPLANLPNLEMLWLDSTPVTDLSPLYGLTNLKWIKLRDTQLTEQEVEDFRNALPECDVVYSQHKNGG